MLRLYKRGNLRNKILLGYFLIIGFIIVFVILIIGFFWKSYVQESIFKTMRNNNYQIQNGIDYYFDDIVKLSEYPYTDEEITNILRKNYKNVQEGSQKINQISDINTVSTKLYKNIFYMNKNIDSVWLFFGNADCYALKTKGVRDSTYNIKNEKWYPTILEGKGKPYIIGIHNDSGNALERKVISVARSIIDPINGEYLGMIIINTRIEDFATLWYSSDYNGSIIAVADKNNHLIFPEVKGMDFEDFDEYINNHEGSFKIDKAYKVKIKGDSYYLVCSKLDCMDGYIYQMNSVSTANEGIRAVFWWILLGTTSLIAILLLVSIAISNSIMKPVSKLVDSMKVVEDGNLQIQTEEFSGELEVLSTTFNRMMKKMEDMFIKVREKEKEKRDMEILALQSQINPHFMYNTLNSIRWMAEIQGADNITQMLDALIKVLKYIAADMGEFVTVETELEFIKNYIKILNFRYFERFSFIYNIDDNIHEYQTLRFILQPIIENAVLHGFDSTDLYATIEIKIFLQDTFLVFEITDNGKGISKEKCEEILNKENLKGKSLNRIGMYNINKRIQLIYGEDYAIKINSKEGCYTKVIVRIPAILSEKPLE